MPSCTASPTATGSGMVTWSASTAVRNWPDGRATPPSASLWARPARPTCGWSLPRRTLSPPGLPRPRPGPASVTSPAPSAGWGAQRVMESRPVSAAMASAATCTRTRTSPTMAGRAVGCGCGLAWRSPSSRCSWGAAAMPSGSPGTAGRCTPPTAAGPLMSSTPWPSPTPGRASSPCPERRCSASPGREPPEDLLQGALHLGHVRTQLSNIGLALSNIGLELSNIGLELGNIALEPGNIALEPGDVALEDVHVRGQSPEQTAMPVLGLLDLGRVHPELGQVGPEVGQVGPDCALALSHGLGLARSCPCLQRLHAHL